MRLKNKNVVVTGGSSGIGRAICTMFAAEGARVFIADIDPKGGAETESTINDSGGTATFIKTDISSESGVKSLVENISNDVGSLDVVVNNAGIGVWGTIENVSNPDWDRVFGVNVIGPANVVKYSLPLLRKSGTPAIVNIASISSFIAQPAFVPYNASKGALLQLTRCLALDLAPEGIRVNCVCPGAIYTNLTEHHMAWEGATDREEFFQRLADYSPLKRFGSAEEVASAALFLASEEASFITGAHLVVDGGATI